MQNNGNFLLTVLGTVILIVGVFAGIYLMGLKGISWGKIQLAQPEIVTVSGSAKNQVKSQIATFSVGVSSVKDNKDEAIKEVNQKIEEVIKAAKDFGIEEKDVKTENLSVYQGEETYYEEGKQKSRPGQWRVNNTVSIILRDINRASELAGLLFKTGATNVYGPNFSVDEPEKVEQGLVDEAIKDARTKAEAMAKASGRTLGKIVSVSEGTIQNVTKATYLEGAGGGGPSIEPGSSTVTKEVTVTFELK